MYMRNSSKKRKYLIVKLFGTRSCDGSLYVCCCRYNGCINRRDVHISDSTLCEIECFHLEGMSDTHSEFSCVVLGSMDEDAPSHEAMMPRMEKMYMVDEEDATPW